MSGFTFLRDLGASAHKNMADLLGETVLVQNPDGSTFASGLSCVARDPSSQERRFFMGLIGAQVDRVIEIARQGAFEPNDFEPHHKKVLHAGVLYEILNDQNPLGATDGGSTKPGVTVLMCRRMGVGMGELPT